MSENWTISTIRPHVDAWQQRHWADVSRVLLAHRLMDPLGSVFQGAPWVPSAPKLVAEFLPALAAEDEANRGARWEIRQHAGTVPRRPPEDLLRRRQRQLEPLLQDLHIL